VLGLDDAPFVKGKQPAVPIVAVLMEGHQVVEGVAVTTFPVDGDEATTFLATWLGSLRWRRMVQAVVIGGITVAGLGIVDLERLSRELGLPVCSVTRRPTSSSRVVRALTAAGFAHRIPIVERSPPSVRVAPGLYLAVAGTDPERAMAILHSTLGKSRLPEPLRIAHLIGQALVLGQSRGRV
jgi:endonuclease V-like protein UPF0215 family